PGLHARSTHGARLNDEQMIDDYAALVHSMGRQTRVCCRNAFAIQTQAGILAVGSPSDARHEGWPLDRSHCFTDAAFTDAGESDQAKDENLAQWLAFLKTTLNL
ncbi:MAG: hypothetical protein SOZ54_03335, partial [Candidatus Limiplasma sp.]|nr:hypothetical protein [Candidatus Limiplasma sp.]